MPLKISQVLREFTQHYVDLWQEKTGLAPCSHELYAIPSPCVSRTGEDCVYWLPQPFTLEKKLNGVEKAMEIELQDGAHYFYTSQFAGDMKARFHNSALDLELELVQVWSEDDFTRLQENLIGHLLTQKRLKLAPTVFLATLPSEFEMITLCNLTGEVLLETFGSKKRESLAPNLADFLQQLHPVVDNC